MSELDSIKIQGAREHNLKNINLKIPRNSLVVITGLSGSGKSSLAFDTIYAEGQRRYIESLSAYARQFLGKLNKPDLDSIEGLSPAISIEQKTTHRNPRSTVGTVTEIYDYFRILFAKIGMPFCPGCDSPLAQQTIDDIVEKTLQLGNDVELKAMIGAPLIRERKGEYKDLFDRLRSDGFARIMVDGELFHLEEEIKIVKNKKHTIDLIVDRLFLKNRESQDRSRIAGSLELALQKGEGFAKVFYQKKNEAKFKVLNFSTHLACINCDVELNFPQISHRFFSFNSPEGACQECSGIGTHLEFHPDLLVEDKSKSISDGITKGLGWSGDGYWYQATIVALAQKLNFSPDISWEKLSKKNRQIIFYGDKSIHLEYDYISEKGNFSFKRFYEGIIPNLSRRYKTTNSESMRTRMEQKMVQMPCPICKGARLRKEPLSFKIKNKNIFEVTRLSIETAKVFFDSIKLNQNQTIIATQVLKEIKDRLNFLDSVGVGYLTLDRMAGTLSGGEAQRIRLATQIGSALTGVLYVLDEPSIGLHQSDNARLIKTLKRLRDLGNTVIVVEHDEETIENADFIVDMGLGAGVHGGEVVFSGTFNEILKDKKSLTAQYLSGRKKILIPKERRKGHGKLISVKKASANNLKNISVDFPLGKFICVTGLSGSGKSTLVNETLYKAISQKINNSYQTPGIHQAILGLKHIDKIIDIDQSPIGRTPRSNPATYTGAFTPIRELFSQLTASQMRGYKIGRFSFNVHGGRCEACQGDGMKKIEMHFLSDVYVTCEVCNGQRYNHETLEVRYKTKNIFEILEMSVEEALSFFNSIPSIKNKLQALFDVGLGYIKLGQSAITLSGGEAQRVKLATELARRSTGKTLYILDEPTTGLHFEDIRQLLLVLHRFVDEGNTVLVIEHNMDVIKTADHIIDMGPAGGANGGRVLAVGTPEQIIENKSSITGEFLRRWLNVIK